jgi:hypothetical protein
MQKKITCRPYSSEVPVNDICPVKVLETIDDVMDLARVLLLAVH